MRRINETKLIDDPCSSIFNDTIINDFNENFANNHDILIENFYTKLKESVKRRVQTIPNRCKACSLSLKETVKFTPRKCEHAKVAILFSGGIDSAVLASLVDECVSDKEEPIDLLNIAFEKSQTNHITKTSKKTNKKPTSLDLDLDLEYNRFLVPDRVSGLETLKELNSLRKWNFVHVNVTLDELKQVTLNFKLFQTTPVAVLKFYHITNETVFDHN